MKRLLILGVWIFAVSVTLFTSLVTYSVRTRNQLAYADYPNTPSYHNNESAVIAYASLPTTVSEIHTQVLGMDARPAAIERYFEAYNSPLVGMGDFIVKTADKHDMDPYLIVAIAQQESNLCKIIPDDSFNCWGWGIHSEGTLRFQSYQEAAQAVIRGLKENYLDKGYTTPEKIMAKYTPQSSGSWAIGVTQFLRELRSGNI